MKLYRILIPILFNLLLSSCTGLSDEQNNNAEFYNTEWSTADESQGIKFYGDDSVLFFWEYGRGSGRFEYYPEEKTIAFKDFTMTSQGETSEFTYGLIQDDGSMKLLWHKFGKSDNYYMILYKRR